MVFTLQECNSSFASSEFPEHLFAKHGFAFNTEGRPLARRAWTYDTLFGAFQVDAWRSNTSVRHIGIVIEDFNLGSVELFFRETDSSTTKLNVKIDHDNHAIWFDLPDKGCGIIYPVLKLDDNENDQPYKIRYICKDKPLSKIKMAVAIPTFCREDQVINNANRIAKHCYDSLSGEYTIIIIDNGRTLNIDNFLPLDNIRLISNKNLGGAGGFARGMLSASEEKAEYTHILMCDDDADICPESITRAAIFLSYCEKETYLGGTMLYQHDRNCIHEAGAAVMGPYGFKSYRQGLRVNKPWDLAAFDKQVPVEYFGWYMVAYPVSILKRFGYPEPFFIRFDDQEFGLRLISRGVNQATLLGVCVWHEAFHLRDSQVTHYYLSRNGIISMMLHRSDIGRVAVSKQLFGEFIRSLFSLRYDRASFILDGINDAMRGSYFIDKVDAQKLNTDLAKKQMQKIKKASYKEMDNLPFDPPYIAPSKFRLVVTLLTLGGHLLPSKLVRKKSFGYINSVRPSAVVRCDEVFYYEPITQLGWVAKRNRKRFVTILLQSGLVFVRLFGKYNQIRSDYKKREHEITGADAWKTRF